MKQIKIQSIPGMINAGGLILGGVTDLSASIGLTFNTQTEIAQELTDLVMACGNHEQTKQTKVTRRSALMDAVNDTRFYVRSLRDVLKRCSATTIQISGWGWVSTRIPLPCPRRRRI